MLDLQLYKRQTGKTTKVIQMMQEDPDALLIIPNIHMKDAYPKEFHQRILTALQFTQYNRHEGRTISKIIMDEPFSIKDYMIPEIFYKLGRELYWCDVIALGTSRDQLAK